MSRNNYDLLGSAVIQSELEGRFTFCDQYNYFAGDNP